MNDTEKPLKGVRVMVTRASAQAQQIYENLTDLGAEVAACPTIEIEEYLDPKGWNLFDKIKSENRWLIFTSETGVRFFIKQFLEQFADIKQLDEFKIAAIGQATANDTQKSGLRVDFIPQEATAVAMGSELIEKFKMDKAEVVRIRGVLAADTIEKTMTKAGATVIPINVYNTYFPKWLPELKQKLFDSPPDVILFSSGSTVQGLIENLSQNELKILTSNAAVYSIGPSTSETLKNAGLNISAEANPHNMSALIDLLQKNVCQKTDGRSQ